MSAGRVPTARPRGEGALGPRGLAVQPPAGPRWPGRETGGSASAGTGCRPRGPPGALRSPATWALAGWPGTRSSGGGGPAFGGRPRPRPLSEQVGRGGPRWLPREPGRQAAAGPGRGAPGAERGAGLGSQPGRASSSLSTRSERCPFSLAVPVVLRAGWSGPASSKAGGQRASIYLLCEQGTLGRINGAATTASGGAGSRSSADAICTVTLSLGSLGSTPQGGKGGLCPPQPSSATLVEEGSEPEPLSWPASATGHPQTQKSTYAGRCWGYRGSPTTAVH